MAEYISNLYPQKSGDDMRPAYIAAILNISLASVKKYSSLVSRAQRICP